MYTLDLLTYTNGSRIQFAQQAKRREAQLKELPSLSAGFKQNATALILLQCSVFHIKPAQHSSNDLWARGNTRRVGVSENESRHLWHTRRSLITHILHVLPFFYDPATPATHYSHAFWTFGLKQIGTYVLCPSTPTALWCYFFSPFASFSSPGVRLRGSASPLEESLWTHIFPTSLSRGGNPKFIPQLQMSPWVKMLAPHFIMSSQ